ncbi:MAG: LytR C-terminal domain-containing protein, partial [Nocardioidaceae bacterium]
MSHTKTAITLLVLTLMFVGGVIAGFRLVTSPIPELDLESETSEPTCKNTTLAPGSELAREQVTVDVYNAGTVSGLASQTQRRLSRYDSQRGLIANADELKVG